MNGNGNGNFKPTSRIRLTRDQRNQAVKIAYTFLSTGWPNCEVRDMLRDKFEGISKSSADRILCLARAKLSEEVKYPKQFHRSRLVAKLEEVMKGGPGITAREMVRAVEAYAKLLGLNDNTPAVPFTGPEQVDVHVPDWRGNLRVARDEGRLLSARNGDGNGTGNGTGGNAADEEE